MNSPANHPNPLLRDQLLPAFDEITWDHIEPALTQALTAHKEGLDEVLADPEPTWTSLVETEEQLGDWVARVWNPVAQLQAVANSPELQTAHAEAKQRLSEHFTQLAQDNRRRLAYQRLKTGQALEGPQAKLVEDRLLELKLAGVDLDAESKQGFLKLQSNLAALSTDFMANVLSATEAWTLNVTRNDLSGLPDTVLDILRQRAKARDEENFTITLDQPAYLGVMGYADSPELRRRVFEAYASRAGEREPDFDNTAVIKGVLDQRRQAAHLLGFDSHAAVSFARKMAPSPARALEFLESLVARVKPIAQREFDELSAWARENGAQGPLQPWDIRYYSEKMRLREYDLDEEALRPYFPLPRAVQGMMQVAQRLFGLEFELHGDAPTWHESVQTYRVLGVDGELKAYFYLDATARPGKREGAWMDVCRTLRRTDAGVMPPVAFLNTNFAAQTADHPSLLTHREVITLFHEFGHGLHHMLSRIETPSQSGINGVEWDAVELPSQFMENWCWQPEALALFSGHYETSEPLPATEIDRLIRARHFQSAMGLLRQLEFGLFDLRLHLGESGESALEIWRGVRDDISVTPTADFERFPNYFAHIFAGGYDAGYYSYLWAQQLASDAFDAFYPHDIFSGELGGRFRREILERGSSRTAMESYVAFRGREPQLEPLLRHYGIAA